jgi:hypothetical protein
MVGGPVAGAGGAAGAGGGAGAAGAGAEGVQAPTSKAVDTRHAKVTNLFMKYAPFGFRFLDFLEFT